MRGVEFTDAQIAEKKTAIISWLYDSVNGVFTTACEMHGVSKSLGYLWIKNDPQFSVDVEKARQQAVESGLDIAENALLEAIREKNMTAIIFYLKCKGKKRDYIDKVIIAGDKDNPLTVSVLHDASVEFRKLLSIAADSKASGGALPLTLDQQRAPEPDHATG